VRGAAPRVPSLRGTARLARVRWLHSKSCEIDSHKFLPPPAFFIGRFLKILNPAAVPGQTHHGPILRSAEFGNTLVLELKPPFSLPPIPLVSANGAR
jgi:hypothetical protein